ncbi:hypothetical protein [Gloeobacter kilaueensis]|uniref:Uncharacterized protein n=1 Tax=Gloeobacter kilaueensis (strain ATCC BAA-2537 / CCAP 1431/1 / ULC 316 / JS1) TaxID=1183438 RepID=U5QK87_GLOK1|nr:hypothetical protein [Gloeobacter kilaueensis]AGY58105.1 hypothetical protein GKIL_1859 [Gloeobacter kilaueensis JS1]
MEGTRLVLLLRNTVIGSELVCTGCLYADLEGRPRYRGERWLCASDSSSQTGRFRCQMGFHLAQIQAST